mmetsp:Transcript_92272/g.266310  ORF Transcript_92272/g.266310 Transcript_92272/m.266310 type:complete len:462 (+) Transcript_92272:768-2153(+)
MQGLHSLRLLLPGLLVCGELRVAPALVLRLLVRLLHEAHDEVLDHLFHLRERIVGNTHRERRKHPAVQPLAPRPQELRHTLLRLARPAGPQLRQRRAFLLREGRQVLLRVALHRIAGQDLDGLLDRLDFLRTQLLPRLEVRCLLLASRHQVGKVLLIRLLGRRRVAQVALGVRLGLQLLRLRLRLLATVRRRLLDLRRQVLHQHVEGMLAVHLGLLQGSALVHELVVELLQHLDDAMGPELVARRLRRRHLQPFRILSALDQEEIDRLLSLVRNKAHGLQLRHLRQGSLRPVVRLLLQDRDRAQQGIHRLRVVLVHHLVVCFLDGPNICRGLLVAVPCRDVRIVLRDLLRQLRRIRGVLLNICLQNLDGLLGLLDRALLVHSRVVAELLVRRKLHLLLMLLLLALGHHVLQQLDHLLHRRDRRPDICGQGAPEDKGGSSRESLHCARGESHDQELELDDCT